MRTMTVTEAAAVLAGASPAVRMQVAAAEPLLGAAAYAAVVRPARLAARVRRVLYAVGAGVGTAAQAGWSAPLRARADALRCAAYRRTAGVRPAPATRAEMHAASRARRSEQRLARRLAGFGGREATPAEIDTMRTYLHAIGRRWPYRPDVRVLPGDGAPVVSGHGAETVWRHGRPHTGMSADWTVACGQRWLDQRAAKEAA